MRAAALPAAASAAAPTAAAAHPAQESGACPPSLPWLLHGLLGRELPVLVAPAHREDGRPVPQRPVLAAGRLLLPHALASGAADSRVLARAAIAHAVAHLRHSVPARPVGQLKPMAVAVISALEDVRVERLLGRELPGVKQWFARGLALSARVEGLGFAALLARMDRALAEPWCQDGNHWVEKARDLFEAQAAADLEDYAAFRRIASVLANDLGQMRVPFRAQEFVVPAAYRDDHGYLWQLPDPQQPPLPVAFTSTAPREDAGGTAARTQPAREGAEVELGRWCHPEWDARAGIERADWATVVEKRPAWRVVQAAATPAGRTPLALRPHRQFAQARRLRAQEGEHLDLNAALDSMVAWRCGRTPDTRIFQAGGRARTRSSVLVLLDLSQSTNDRVDPGGPTLLALECEAALLLAQAASQAGTGDRVAVHGFHSDGRDCVSYYRMVDFGAPLDAVAQAMIAQAPARCSTRMGAAVRHATRCLQHEQAARRALLLVTDGVPSDIDVHVPDYLVEDARAAVLSARRAGIHVHALAVDPAGDRYLRRICGATDFGIVERPQTLGARLRQAYARLCGP